MTKATKKNSRSKTPARAPVATVAPDLKPGEPRPSVTWSTPATTPREPLPDVKELGPEDFRRFPKGAGMYDGAGFNVKRVIRRERIWLHLVEHQTFLGPIERLYPLDDEDLEKLDKENLSVGDLQRDAEGMNGIGLHRLTLWFDRGMSQRKFVRLAKVERRE